MTVQWGHHLPTGGLSRNCIQLKLLKTGSADGRKVKIHYTGYSQHYDEWIRKSQIGCMPVLLPHEGRLHDVELQLNNLSILASCIKQKFIIIIIIDLIIKTL